MIGNVMGHVNVHIDFHLISCYAALYRASGEPTLVIDVCQSASRMRRNYGENLSQSDKTDVANALFHMDTKTRCVPILARSPVFVIFLWLCWSSMFQNFSGSRRKWVFTHVLEMGINHVRYALKSHQIVGNRNVKSAGSSVVETIEAVSHYFVFRPVFGACHASLRARCARFGHRLLRRCAFRVPRCTIDTMFDRIQGK